MNNNNNYNNINKESCNPNDILNNFFKKVDNNYNINYNYNNNNNFPNNLMEFYENQKKYFNDINPLNYYLNNIFNDKK